MFTFFFTYRMSPKEDKIKEKKEGSVGGGGGGRGGYEYDETQQTDFQQTRKRKETKEEMTNERMPTKIQAKQKLLIIRTSYTKSKRLRISQNDKPVNDETFS